jgi:hypothetical protein
MARAMPYERARSRLAKHRLQDILRSDRDHGRDAQTPSEAKPVEAAPSPASTPRARRRLSGTCDEPIRTRSMARLLASQGQHDRALAIYEALVAVNGGDAALQAELEAVRQLVEASASV